eukprot:gnl/TRDRNA2_/TRDRNA2_76585_c1_seq1.p1 gnl/TRDRNA2_/TRDRNA2_76585_c1~~gnl/TRDRNA2_/TRDRNA2_76585_c1_seq1.p1  ORF type:complete len:122 (-),score=10.53 gnl/TRDRNA2_/TRDRNA2_76585_c1_seq1:38-403(-)
MCRVTPWLGESTAGADGAELHSASSPPRKCIQLKPWDSPSSDVDEASNDKLSEVDWDAFMPPDSHIGSAQPTSEPCAYEPRSGSLHCQQWCEMQVFTRSVCVSEPLCRDPVCRDPACIVAL